MKNHLLNRVRKYFASFLVVEIMLLTMPYVFAAATTEVAYRGVLRGSSGSAVTSATDLKLCIFSASTGGTAVYALKGTATGNDCSASTAVSITPNSNGEFSVLIGDTGSSYNALDDLDMATSEYWMEFVVGSTTLSPRQKVTNAFGARNVVLQNSEYFTNSTDGTISTAPSATGSFNVTTGNLKIGNGTPTVTLDGEDAYVEGTFEADGASRFDGAVTALSTLGVTGATTLSSTLGVTGATTLSSTLGVTGATTLSSTLGVTGDVAVNTNKFNVTAASGNTSIGGTLGVTGATTLASTLGVTGATTLSGTLGVTGTTTLQDLTVNGTLTTGAGTLTSSALNITGNSTLGSDSADLLTVSGTLQGASPFTFEGNTADAFETIFAITDPTADRTITFPDSTGTLATLTGSETFTNKTLTSPIIGTSPTAAGATWANLGAVTTADINGGTLDSVVIGGATPAAASFTTLGASGASTLGGTLGVTGASTFSSTLGVTGATTLGSTLGVAGISSLSGSVILGDANTDDVTVNGEIMNYGGNNIFAFEGSTDDNFETFLAIVDPTADRTITLPNESGTMVTTGVATLASLSSIGQNGTVTTIEGNSKLGADSGDTTTISGAATLGSTLGVTGATTLSSTLGITGNVAVNTDKFTVTAASGNTAVGGTLGVTGATTLSSTLGVTGNVAVNTDKFTVTAASGNTAVGGTLGVTGATTLSSTLGVTGATTLSSTLGVTGDVSVNTNKFNVTAASGNTSIAGTLGVTGTTTLQDLTVNGTLTTGAGTLTSSALSITGNSTLGSDSADLVTLNGVLQGASPFILEGSTADAFETTFAITDPTADRTITFPDSTGTLATLAGTETFTNKTLTSPIIGTSPTALGATWANLGTVTTADINGGTLDGVVIGGAAAAAGSFTTLGASGAATLGSTLGITGDVAVNTNKFNVTAASGNTSIAGTLGVTGTTTLQDLTVNGTLTTGAGTLTSSALSITGNSTLGSDSADLVTLNGVLQGASPFILEGSTADAFETTFAITDPTADRTITFPDSTGTLATLAGTETFTNKTLTSPIIGTSPTALGATWADLGSVTTADINGGTLDGVVIGGAAAAAGSFTTLGASGAATLSSTLGITGDVSVNTNKFNVTAASGNTSIAGTLGITGAATLGSTLGITGDVSVNTNKFNVTAASGNTSIAGTLGVTGTTTLQDLTVNGTLTTGAGTLTSSALNITGNSTLGSDSADLVTLNGVLQGASPFILEGSTADNFETTIAITDPTADRTITLPDSTGTLATLAGTETFTNKTLTSPIIGTSPTALGATWADLGSVTTADINGGTLDGVVIGGVAAAAGSFTTLGASGAATLSSTLGVTGAVTLNDAVTLGDLAADVITLTGTVAGASPITFEGATTDANEITIAVSDPGADVTVTIPATTGTLITTGDTGTVSSTMITNDTITASDINATLTFADSDLINLSAVNASGTAEGLILPQAADVSAATAEGQISWDTDGDALFIGTGAVATQVVTGASTNTFTGSNTFGDAVTDGLTFTAAIQGANAFILDGVTDDTNEITIAVSDPGADVTVTIPSTTGTLITTGDTGTVSSTMITNDTITASDINATLTFADADLINLSAVNASGTAEGLILPQAADVSAATAEGQISWDTDGDALFIGTGAVATQVVTGASTNTFTGSNTFGDAITDGLTFTAAIQGANALILDGVTDDTNELTIAITDPTADRTITFPNLTGTVSLLDATETLTNKTLTSPIIGTSPTALGATWASLGTVTTADINGGTLDGVIIGGATPAAASVTTLGASGAATLSSTLGVTGDVAVNTNKFNVTAASGNTTVGGTLGVTGATTLSSTLGVGADGAGTDVTFYTDTATEEFLWDASENQIALDGTDGTTVMNITDGNVVIADTLTVGTFAPTSLTVGGGYGSTGVTISAAGAIQANDALTIDSTSTLTGAVTASSALSVGSILTLAANNETISNATDGSITFATNTLNADTISIEPKTGGAGTFAGTITSADLTAARTWTFPNSDGTMVLTGSANIFTVAQEFDAGFTVDDTAFIVADTTGNTTVAGTIGVTGAATLTSTLSVGGILTLASNNETISNATDGSITFATNTLNADTISIAPKTGGAGTFAGTITSADLTAARTWTFPDSDGTFLTAGANTFTGAQVFQNNITATLAAANLITVDASSTATTTTGGVLDMNVGAGDAQVDGINLAFTVNNGATAAQDYEAQVITLTANDADADVFGIVITGADGTADAGSYEAGIKIDNADTTAGSMSDAILITSTGADTGITDAIDVSNANITNAINVGSNTILGTTGNIDYTNFDVVGATGNTTVGGTFGVTGDVAVNTNKFNVTAASGNTSIAGTLGVTGAVTLADDITSTDTGDLGWSVQSAADQACSTTCTKAAVFGFDSGLKVIVGPADATADVCVCAGAN